MDTIKFSTNWNGKLTNSVFSTLRVKSAKYEKGKTFIIEPTFNGMDKFQATIINLFQFRFDDIPQVLCYLDTGYDKEATQEILKKMYPDIYDTVTYYHILLKRVENGN